MSTQTQVVVFEPQLLDELNLSQRLAANFLEVGYLKLRDFPDIAKKVRMTADDAQTQHMMTLGLMKKFKGTAQHVVTEMIPLMKEGIELQVPEITIDAMKTVIGYANKMKTNTEETQKRYLQIKSAVQGHIADVVKENETVTETKRNLDNERQDHMDRLTMMGTEYQKLEKENEAIRKQMEESEKARREYLSKSIPTEDDKEREGYFDNIMVPAFTLLTVAAAGPVAGLIAGGAQWTANYLRRNQTSEQAVQASEKEEKKIETLDKQKEDKSKSMRKFKEDALENIARLRRLALTKASLGDVRDLEQAIDELGKVGKHLEKIALFWTDFAAKFESFVECHDSAQILLNYIQKPGVVGAFNQRLDVVAKCWEGFGGMCVSYVDQHSGEITSLYSFLTAPVDRLSIGDREDRQKKLLEQMEADIKAIKF